VSLGVDWLEISVFFVKAKLLLFVLFMPSYSWATTRATCL
jgi:hypothetical protein